jgi:hypothetical protein
MAAAAADLKNVRRVESDMGSLSKGLYRMVEMAFRPRRLLEPGQFRKSHCCGLKLAKFAQQAGEMIGLERRSDRLDR